MPGVRQAGIGDAPHGPVLLGGGPLLGAPRRRGARHRLGQRAVDPDRRRPPHGRARLCAQAIDRDRADGVVPVAVVATSGTTLTGAVDDLDALADVCQTRDVWLHVDGAYGLPAASTRRAGHRFAGLHRADSATVDAHKWLYVPKSCSVLLVHHAGALERAFSHHEGYIPHGEQLHPVDRTLEYSRPLSSLKLWLAFVVHGAERIRAAIERNLEEAALLADLLRDDSRFELLMEPSLSVVCFRRLTPEPRRRRCAQPAFSPTHWPATGAS